LENGKVDLIVEKHNNYYKLQIKTIQKYKESKLIPLRKISHNMGTYKIKTYTSEDIDFFVGIDLETEDLYIIPVSITSAYNNSISIKKCFNYKNNFKQMEPYNGNIISGDDDNVESLTDNADGNDVGMN